MTRNQKYYRRGKAKAEQLAIEFQMYLSDYDNRWDEDSKWGWYSVWEWTEYFRKIGKRFGLLREFRENAII